MPVNLYSVVGALPQHRVCCISSVHIVVDHAGVRQHSITCVRDRLLVVTLEFSSKNSTGGSVAGRGRIEGPGSQLLITKPSEPLPKT